MNLSAPVQNSDWLEPLVIILRKQLAFMPSLTPSNLTGLVMPGLFPFSGPESSTRDSRCADWICREIKHLCLQILATLLNPAPRRPADSTLASKSYLSLLAFRIAHWTYCLFTVRRRSRAKGRSLQKIANHSQTGINACTTSWK
ncbi:unnamed protein product [Dibothriocephalus latus]|uniref:Uncharacterized protein n=1 Tax=Dibothriocephalus latus TaxID=60516 RepID=A0A3P7NVU2_DIBLA|nr:unnamed protein product [Dibothriocephalus latus]